MLISIDGQFINPNHVVRVYKGGYNEVKIEFTNKEQMSVEDFSIEEIVNAVILKENLC